MRTFVAVLLVCFSFALNCMGQKMKMKNTELYVKGKLYCFIEPIPPSAKNYFISRGYLQNESSGISSYLSRLPSYAIYSPNKSLIAYILPEPGQIRPSKKTPLAYSVLFYPDISPRSIQYPQIDSINPIIQDIVSFELITNNTLDKSALRRLFEKFGKEVKYTELKWWRNPNEGNCGTGSMNSYRTFENFPNYKVNNKEKSISKDNNFIAKYDKISLDKDSLLKEAHFFDQFNKYKASVTLLNAVGDNINNYIFPVRENPVKSKNDLFKLNYKLVTNKGEVRFFTVQVFFDNHQKSSIPPEEKSLTPKIKSQLIKIGEYLQANFFI